MADTPITVFVSYARKDNESSDGSSTVLDRLREYLKPLERRGIIDPFFDVDGIDAGDDWEKKIRETASRARVMIALVGPAFLTSEVVRKVEIPIFLGTESRSEPTILPLLVRPCPLEGEVYYYPDPERGPASFRLEEIEFMHDLNSPLKYMLDGEKDQVFSMVSQRLQELAADESEQVRAARPAGRVLNLPHPVNRFFTNRATDIERISKELESGENRIGSIVVLTGSGGMGKTQLALEYCYRQRRSGHYESLLWINAARSYDVSSSVARIVDQLDLCPGESRDEVHIRELKCWLDREESWLLVIDNLDDSKLVEDILPDDPVGDIIITSRSRPQGALTVARPIELDYFTAEHSVELLAKRSGRSELQRDLPSSRAVTKLAEFLGGYPLLLEQAGAVLNSTEISVGAFLEEVNRAPVATIERGADGVTAYAESFGSIWEVLFRRLEEDAPALAELMKLLAFLDPTSIPLDLLRRGASELDGPLRQVFRDAKHDPLRLYEFIAPLFLDSLVQFDGARGEISVHRVVQLLIIERMSEEELALWSRRAVAVVRRAFDDRTGDGFDDRWTVSPATAIGHLDSAFKLLQRIPKGSDRDREEMELGLALGSQMTATEGFSEPRLLKTYRRCLKLAESLNDKRGAFAARRGLWAYYLMVAQFDDARKVSKALMESAGSLSRYYQTEACRCEGTTLFFLGESQEAWDCLQEGLRLSDGRTSSGLALVFGQDPTIAILCYSAEASWYGGFPDRALDEILSALSSAERLGHSFTRAYARTHLAMIRMLRGEYLEAEELFRAVVARCSQEGFPFWTAMSRFCLGYMQAIGSDTEEGLDLMREAIDEHRSMGASLWGPFELVLLADVHLSRDDVSAAQEVLAQLKLKKAHVWYSEYARLQGEAHARAGAERKSRKTLRKALDAARDQCATMLELRVLSTMVTHCAELFPNALEELRECRSQIGEGETTRDLVRADELLDGAEHSSHHGS